MRYVALAALLGLSFGGRAQAPGARPPADTARAARQWLGLTASPVLDRFFTANRALPLGLAYQRNQAGGRFLRLRLSGRYDQRDTTNNVQFQTGQRRAWQLGGWVGAGWQRPLGQRAKLYYGAEVGGSYAQRQSDEFTYSSNTTGLYHTEMHWKTVRWHAGVQPFAGISVGLGNRLQLWAETATSLLYERLDAGMNGKTDQSYSDGTVGTTFITIHYASNGFSLAWHPVQIVGASFTW